MRLELWIKSTFSMLAVFKVGRTLALVVAGTFWFHAFQNSVHAADGDLDLAFGTGGKVVSNFAGTARSLAVQSDGKIIVAGGVLARYNADGSLDTSFGNGGRAFNAAFGESVLIQSDGRIVTVSGAAIARHEANGVLDTTFGSGGTVITGFAAFLGPSGGAMQPDGKILVVGTVFPNGISGDFAIARYNSDGTPDSTFGTSGGKTTVDLGANDIASAVGIQPDGKIVVGGARVLPASPLVAALARFTTTGTLDGTFGSGGIVVTDVTPLGASEYELPRMALQTDGKILIPGTAVVPGASSGGFVVARYEAGGSLDATFNGTGKAFADFLPFNDAASSVAVQEDGKILVGGSAFNGTFYDFALARFNSDGTLDTGFGTGGKVITDFSSTSDELFAIALQLDGKILAVGRTGSAYFGPFNVALARYENTALTPQQTIQQVIASVNDLISSGDLNQGEANSLIAKLEAALQQLNQGSPTAVTASSVQTSLQPSNGGNTKAAVNQLKAFINEVNALVKSGKLSETRAQPLIDLAKAVIARL